MGYTWHMPCPMTTTVLCLIVPINVINSKGHVREYFKDYLFEQNIYLSIKWWAVSPRNTCLMTNTWCTIILNNYWYQWMFNITSFNLPLKYFQECTYLYLTCVIILRTVWNVAWSSCDTWGDQNTRSSPPAPNHPLCNIIKLFIVSSYEMWRHTLVILSNVECARNGWSDVQTPPPPPLNSNLTFWT